MGPVDDDLVEGDVEGAGGINIRVNSIATSSFGAVHLKFDSFSD
jgi:hypothetical protein